MEKLGIDLGFYQTKATNLETTALFESIVGYDFKSMVRDFADNGISFDDPLAVVGKNAIKYAKNPIRQKDDNWISSPECRILFQAAISELILEAEADVYAVVSLPISIYKSQHNVLKNNLDGTYKFTRHGREEQTIHATVLELPQGFTVLCNEGLDDSGEPSDPSTLELVGIIDIGGRTTNILLSDEMRDVEHQSESINVGCWDMIETLQKLLAEKFNRPSVSEFEVEAALRTGEFSHHGKVEVVKTMVERVKKDALRPIEASIRRLWPDIGSIRKIYVAGGGSTYLGKQLCNIYSQAVTARNPIFANAEGAAKFAKRG